MMKILIIKLFILVTLLLGLPLTGILISGRPLAIYLEFPPETRFISHASFSWLLFWCYTAFIITILIFLLLPILYNQRVYLQDYAKRKPFPWWGWLSLFAWIVFWGIAWSRFPFLERVQPHTFTPLWISFIVLLNALSFRRKGYSMLTHKTRLFLILFPLSAAFWWFFEYLNRFVQNWYYVGVKFGALEYFLYATLSFSTVLPAVTSMQECLNSYCGYHRHYRKWIKVNVKYPKTLSWCVLIVVGCSLGCIGILPNYLFPLLWISPLLIVVCLQTILGEPHILSDIVHGNWANAISFSTAALACGVFWELWNFYSLAKWQYSIPFLHRFQLFEMPVLGYAGYLPFGLECALVVMTAEAWIYKKRFR